MSLPLALVLTCEHGGNEVPEPYRALFQGPTAQRALESHRGYDPGALSLARALAARFGAPLVSTRITRLLVEPNRSIGHRSLFSEFSSSLAPAARDHLVEQYYLPHRAAVLEVVEGALSTRGAVLHVGVHSFTPELNGRPRTADVGLLYDPSRPEERALCARWKRALGRTWPEARVRRNYPYLGKSDGLTTELRSRFPAGRYLGIELEVNNARLVDRDAQPDVVARRMADALVALGM